MTRFGKSAVSAFAAGLILAAGACRVAAAPSWTKPSGVEGAVVGRVICSDSSSKISDVIIFGSETGSMKIGALCVFVRNGKVVGRAVVAQSSKNRNAALPLDGFVAKEGDAVYPQLTRN